MVYRMDTVVDYSDLNAGMCLSNAAILRLFENAATRHGNAIRDGILFTPSRWFLTGYRVRVHRRPRGGEEISVRTWSRAAKGMFACREFEITGADGRPAVTALSNWMRFSSETAKPERIPAEVMERYGSEPDRTSFGAEWLKNVPEPAEHDLEREHFIDRIFIDANGHMNNVSYLDLANMTLPEEVFREGESDAFEIMYRKSAMYAETVKALFTAAEDAYTVSIRTADLSGLHAVIRMERNTGNAPRGPRPE